jgi:hypothetical protein
MQILLSDREVLKTEVRNHGKMDCFFNMVSKLKFIFRIAFLLCFVCSCNKKEVSGDNGAQEKVVSQKEDTFTTNSIDIKPSKDSKPKGNFKELENLKKIISGNLPNIEKQLQEALGSRIKLEMVIEDKTETAASKVDLNEKHKDVDRQLEEIQKNSMEKK